MYDLRRSFNWTAETPDPLAVMRALVPVFQSGITKWYLKTEGYRLDSTSTSIERAKDLEHSARRVADELRSIAIVYKTPFELAEFLRRPDCDFKLSVDKGYDYRSNPDRPVRVSLSLQGPDTDTAAGIMDRIKTQVESELGRQNRDGWQFQPAAMPIAPGFLRRALINPWFVTLVGGIVVTFLMLALTAGCNYLVAVVNESHQDPTISSEIPRAPGPHSLNR